MLFLITGGCVTNSGEAFLTPILKELGSEIEGTANKEPYFEEPAASGFPVAEKLPKSTTIDSNTPLRNHSVTIQDNGVLTVTVRNTKPSGLKHSHVGRIIIANQRGPMGSILSVKPGKERSESISVVSGDQIRISVQQMSSWTGKYRAYHNGSYILTHTFSPTR